MILDFPIVWQMHFGNINFASLISKPSYHLENKIEDFEFDHSFVFTCRKNIFDCIFEINKFIYQSNYAKEKPFIPAESDELYFGRLWPSLRDLYKEGKVFELIRIRKEEIKSIKNYWRIKIRNYENGPLHDFYHQIKICLENGYMRRIQDGGGAAYLAYSNECAPLFVIKPFDEDLLCLNNCKYYGNPLNVSSMRVRHNIPLYRSHQTDVLAYEIACCIGLEKITPKTVMNIVHSPVFFDIADLLSEEKKKELFYSAGQPDKEKLCSVQSYVSSGTNFVEIVQNWIDQDLSDDSILAKIDQDDFEDANIFVWTIYDTDAHAGNFFAYHKNWNEHNEIVYGIIKIDNGLCFPKTNSGFQNFLKFLPNANFKLSERACHIISTISLNRIRDIMNAYELDNCYNALETRISVLKKLAESENLTIYDIDLRMKVLEFDNGQEIALSDISRKDLEQMIWKKSSENPFQEASVYSSPYHALLPRSFVEF